MLKGGEGLLRLLRGCWGVFVVFCQILWGYLGGGGGAWNRDWRCNRQFI